MKRAEYFLFAVVFASIACFIGSAAAQVPQLINYQGRVDVGGVNFNGTGRFKFALVDGAGGATYWTNNGASNGSGEPTASVSLNVTNGLYSVLLGNTALPGMTSIPASVFNNADVRLRVWFDDGVHGFQLLTPDERIAAVGYAMKAAFASTVANGAITADKIAAGAVAANLNAGGQSGVASGGLILSLTVNPALVAAGYLRIGTTALDGFISRTWQAAPAPASGTPPAPRRLHTAVWTGTEMIIWGGSSTGLSAGVRNDGGRYNPATNTWTPLSAIGAPAARMNHTAIWANGEMIVWAGKGSGGALNDGCRYNPANDTWTPIASGAAPGPRSGHTAVWTGSKMIVWGGTSASGSLNDGGRYNLANDTWEPVTTVDAPAARRLHAAVWTGTEMIVWGGSNLAVYFGDGKRYNPASDTWSEITGTGAPSARSYHTAVWTGSRMLVWGGYDENFRNDGARYNPAADSWEPMASSSAPAGRFKHSVVWTGSEMIIWGGYGGAFLNTGGSYDPTANTWVAIPPVAAPTAREEHSAVWTGSQMIVWGGFYANGGDIHLNDMWFLFSGPQIMHLYQKP